jgi:hypothetical protein
MKKILIVLFAVLFLGMAACQPAVVETPVSEPQADAESDVEEPTTTTVTQPVALLEPATDYCLDCHTDKDRLVTLAVEAADSHGSESEGVG